MITTIQRATLCHSHAPAVRCDLKHGPKLLRHGHGSRGGVPECHGPSDWYETVSVDPAVTNEVVWPLHTTGRSSFDRVHMKAAKSLRSTFRLKIVIIVGFVKTVGFMYPRRRRSNVCSVPEHVSIAIRQDLKAVMPTNVQAIATSNGQERRRSDSMLPSTPCKCGTATHESLLKGGHLRAEAKLHLVTREDYEGRPKRYNLITKYPGFSYQVCRAQPQYRWQW